MPPSFWVARPRPILPMAWGDYGDILQHGMSMHLPRVQGRIALERTGPYILPITMPGALVVTREVRTSLESSGLTGFSFAEIEKARIVEMHWEMWDLEADTPKEYPESGEPEDYILERPHSPEAAQALGDLFEIVSPSTLTITRPRPIVKSFRELSIDSSTWNGSDLIKSKDYGALLFSDRAAEWFSENWGQYLDFEQFPSH